MCPLLLWPLFLILVQGFSSKVRYDRSSCFLSCFTFSNENQWQIKKNDAMQRARQPACELFSDPRTRIFIKSQIWLVMPFFALFYLLQWKPMKHCGKWRQTASQAASLRAHFWSSYKDFHQKSGLPGALGLPGQFSLWFLLKNNKEISSRELWVLQVNFPYGFLLKTIRKSPPGSSGSSRSIFLMVSY